MFVVAIAAVAAIVVSVTFDVIVVVWFLGCLVVIVRCSLFVAVLLFDCLFIHSFFLSLIHSVGRSVVCCSLLLFVCLLICFLVVVTIVVVVQLWPI